MVVDMKKVLMSALLLFCTTHAFAKESDAFEGLYTFLSGKYALIGQAINSQKTYQGTMTLEYEEHKFKVIREIEGQRVEGIGVIEEPILIEAPKMLRITFTQNNQKYVGLYLWHTEFDNYARITGKLNLLGKDGNSPGLEALFALK